jgi:methyltransferase (TIGR00027 family)
MSNLESSGGVCDTAFMVAALRAIETKRSDALFRDPLAEELAGARGKSIAANFPQSSVAIGNWSVAIRTVVVDALIQSAIAQGADTIINLGAGLDTRPYRMILPAGIRWIEVDYPSIIDFKNQCLVSRFPRCNLERVKLDLRNLSERHRFLSHVGVSSKNIVVLTEGIIPYFTVEEVALLADDIRDMSTVRAWIIDYLSPEITRLRQEYESQYPCNAPVHFAPDDWSSFFGEHGWTVTDIRYLVEEGARCNRSLPLPLIFRIGIEVLHLFGMSGPRERMRHLLAYVMLKPT